VKGQEVKTPEKRTKDFLTNCLIFQGVVASTNLYGPIDGAKFEAFIAKFKFGKMPALSWTTPIFIKEK
jgi:hypothetical protein